MFGNAGQSTESLRRGTSGRAATVRECPMGLRPTKADEKPTQRRRDGEHRANRVCFSTERSPGTDSPRSVKHPVAGSLTADRFCYDEVEVARRTENTTWDPWECQK